MNPGGEQLFLALYEGTVIDVADKANLHRVRVSIPGVCRESAWARPRTAGGGAAQRGGNAVPPVGATVLVQFVGGDIRSPVYEGGPWGNVDGISELPADVVAAGADAALVAAFEFSRGATTVRLTIDEREGHRSWRIVAVQKQGETEQVLGSIELDLENRVLDLFALAGVQIRSKGFVDLLALAVRAQRRRIRRTAAPL